MARRSSWGLGLESVLLLIVLLRIGEVTSASPATEEPHNATTTTAIPTTTEAFDTTTLGPWYTQATPEPERCWNGTRDFRPLNWLPTLFAAENTPLLSCQTFCERTYNTCQLLAYSEQNQMCKIYDIAYTLQDMSYDPEFITQTPINCDYDFAFVTETVKWSQAQTACLGLQGQFASVMDDKQAEDIADAFPLSVKEAWLGVKYIGGQWLWENGMAATEQRYFREQPFNNVSSSSPICGKAVIEFRRKNLRKIYIEQEDCSVQLPVICQFKDGLLPTDPPTLPPTEPWWQSDLFFYFIKTTLPIPTTTTTLPTTTVPTTPTPIPTLPVPVPEAKTSGPFSTDPVHTSIGASMSFIMLGVIILIVVLDMATMSKEVQRMKGNLMGCYMECRYGDDGTLDPTAEEEYYNNMAYDKDELPDYRIPVSQYQAYA